MDAFGAALFLMTILHLCVKVKSPTVTLHELSRKDCNIYPGKKWQPVVDCYCYDNKFAGLIFFSLPFCPFLKTPLVTYENQSRR